MRTLRVLPIVVAATLASTAHDAFGQQFSPAECDSAITALSGGSRQPMDWFWVNYCGSEGAVAIAMAIEGARSETDSVFLQTLWATAHGVQHPTIVESAMEVAADPAATQRARITSMLILMNQIDREMAFSLSIPWIALVNAPRGGDCRVYPGDAPPLLHDSEIPEELRSDAAVLLEEVARNGQESAVLRSVARCVRYGIGREVPEEVDPDAITLTYICADKFSVSNNGNHWITVRFRVLGTAEERDLTVAPGGVKRYFVTQETGTVEIEYLGNVVETVANGGIPCP